MRGQDVAQVQRWLAKVPPKKGDPPVDGIYGRQTTTAVKKFQKTHALSMSGAVYRNAWLTLCGAASRN